MHALPCVTVPNGDKTVPGLLLGSILILGWEVKSPSQCRNRGVDGTQRTGSTGMLISKEDHSLRMPCFSLLGSSCVQELGANRGGEPQDYCLCRVLCLGLAPREEQVILTASILSQSASLLQIRGLSRACQKSNRSSHWELVLSVYQPLPEDDEPSEGTHCL